MKNILKWCYKNITSRHPALLLILAFLMSLAGLWVASGLTYNPRLDNLLPSDMPMVQDFEKVREKTGGTGPLVVVVEGLALKNAPEVIDELTRRFEKIPETHFVDSRIPKDFLKNKQLLLAPIKDLEEIETIVDGAVEYAQSQLSNIFGAGPELYNPEKLQDFSKDYSIFEDISPFYRGKSKKNYYIFVQPQGTASNTGFTKNFVHSIQREIDQADLTRKFPELKVKLTGSIITRLEENRTILSDLKNSAALAVCLVVLILVIYTRSILSVVLLVAPLLVSLTMTFALTRVFIGSVNIISGFLLAILTGLGINYGIHLYIRFKQELLKGQTISQAAELVATQVGRSGVVAMATTVSVFSVLMFSDFKGFSEFGAIAVMGIICAFTSYFFLLPALILCADKIHWLRKPRPRMFSLKISSIYSNSPTFLAAMFILVLILSLFLLPGIQFEHDFQKLRGDSPAADYKSETSDDFGLGFSPTVIMASSKDDLFYIHQALQRLKEKYGKDSIIGVHHSLGLFGKKEYDSKKGILDRINKKLVEEKDIIEISLGTRRYQKLKKLVEAEPFDEARIPSNLVKRFTAKDEYLLILFSPANKDFYDVRNIFQLEKEMDELKAELAKQNIQIAVLDENLLAAAILDWVKEKGPLTLAASMVLVFIILMWDFRSLRLTIKTFLPLFTGLALTGAMMAVFNVKLNFINMVMIPSIVGIMIDHCVYLGHHILDYSRNETVKSVQETGSAIILSALTSLAGYVSLNIAHHAGVRSIAHVVEMGIITCTICALFMLPVLFEMGAHKSPSFKLPKPDDQD